MSRLSDLCPQNNAFSDFYWSAVTQSIQCWREFEQRYAIEILILGCTRIAQHSAGGAPRKAQQHKNPPGSGDSC
jgi:hypothetical protein